MLNGKTTSIGFALLAITTIVESQSCYWPDHTEAVNYTACNAAAPYSSCCRPWEACMTNGLCFQTQGLANRISRGSCTDQTFSSDACPSACSDVVTDSSLTIFEAYDDVADNGAFCCVLPYNQSTSQCEISSGSAGYQPFALPMFQIIVDRSSGATLPLNGSDATTSTNKTGADTTTTATVTATHTASSDTTAVAAGIAVPLGILLIASLIACGILFSQLRKLRREQESRSAGHEELMGQGGHGMPAPSYSDYKTVPQEQPYNQGQVWAHHASPPPQQPYSPPLAEAPAGREIGEADSRPVQSTYK